MAKIFLKFNAAVISEIKLQKEVTTFGRKEGNDIIVNHPAVSGFHGKIVLEGTDYYVEDLNSTNGTLVNGVPVKKNKLTSKDIIRVAKHVLEFVAEDNANASPATPEELEDAKKAQAASAPPAPKETTAKPKPLNAGADLKNEASLLANSSSYSSLLMPEKQMQEAAESGPMGVIKIISGGAAGQNEVTLKSLVTYIGTSDQAIIKIKGLMAPSLAAAISKRPEGYFLKAVKSGYPKVNGNSVQEQILLESGALIECGGTNMVFYAQGDKKKPS